MRKLNTLNEEINRMKSLFGESRLYGNLVVESYLDDISKKKDEILKILSDWESFNSGRSGLGSGVLKNEIGPLIDDAQEKITKINPNDACNEENIKLLNDNLKSIEENKKDSKYKLLPKTDKDYLNDLETKLKEIKKLCSENVTVKPNKEQPQEKKTSNNEVPTKLMNCDEVDAYDDTRPRAWAAMLQGKWKDENINGLVKMCSNGKATWVFSVKDGKRDGIDRQWHENGQLSYEAIYKDGKKDGIQRKWYENGQLNYVVNTVNDKLEGELKTYYENGDIASTKYFINNEEVSKEKYEGGDNKQEEPTTKEVPTELMNCDEVEAFDSGEAGADMWRIEKVTGLVKGCMNGKALHIWSSKDGKEDGVDRWWHENGQLWSEENYKDGKIDGVSRQWYENGQLEYEKYYINDKEVSKEEYENIHSDVNLPKLKTKPLEKLPEKDKNDNIEIKKDSEKPITPTGSGDIIGVNYRTGKKTIDGVLKKVKDKDGETTFIIKNRKVPILNPRRNGFIDDDAKVGVMDALKNIGIDMTNKTINVINDRKFTIK